jgi:hypothetical protein
MFGPGTYVLDPTEGIVDVKDLPAPQLVVYSRNHKHTLPTMWPSRLSPQSRPVHVS